MNKPFAQKLARLDSLDARIAAMEQRVINAASLGAAIGYHRKLDALRVARTALMAEAEGIEREAGL